jgi:hypothetical protein
MKITDERHKRNTVMFKDLNIGDCFEFRGDFYIKIDPIELSFNEENNYRAFKLGPNVVFAFANDAIVTKVNIEIIIKN